ncbi:MAG TPA: ABC transporter permease [Candidatus Limnocylindrales bacterium]
MTSLRREAGASYAFVERNFNLTKRYLGWEVAFLVYAVAGALSVSLIGQSVGSQRLLMSLVVGAVFWNYLSVVFQSIGDTITWERWEGTLEYTMMAPVRRSTQLLGSALYAVVYGLIHTAILLVVLVLFFSLDLGRANFGAAAIFMLVGSTSPIGIGMLAAILPMMSVERGSQMVFVLQSCLLLVSGVYYPVDILPGWMQLISRISPATYVLDAVRRSIIDGASINQLLPDLWPLLVMAFIFIPLGLWGFGQAERYAKRTGKLKRVG